MRLVYFGYLLGPLKAALESGVEISRVFVEHGPQRTRLMVEFCQERSLNWSEAKDIKTNPTVLEVLNTKPDLCLVGAFGQIVPKDLLSRTRLGWINVHFSYLPFYRGNSPIEWMILSGEEQGGVTYHWINTGVDQGDIIAQARVPIGARDDYADVFERADRAAYELGRRLWDCQPKLWSRKPQLNGRGSYLPLRTEKDRRVDRATRPALADRLIRAEAWTGKVHLSCGGKKVPLLWLSRSGPRPGLSDGTVTRVEGGEISVVLGGEEVSFGTGPEPWRPEPGQMID